MAKKLRLGVYVRNDETAEDVLFQAGSTPPAWAAKKITNPRAWATGDDTDGDDGDGQGDGDGEKPLEEWSKAELKARIGEMREEGYTVDVKLNAPNPELVAAIQAATPPAPAPEDTGDGGGQGDGGTPPPGDGSGDPGSAPS